MAAATIKGNSKIIHVTLLLFFILDGLLAVFSEPRLLYTSDRIALGIYNNNDNSKTAKVIISNKNRKSIDDTRLNKKVTIKVL